MAGNQAPSLNGLCMRPLFSSTPSELLLLLRHEVGVVKRVVQSATHGSGLGIAAFALQRCHEVEGDRLEDGGRGLYGS